MSIELFAVIVYVLILLVTAGAIQALEEDKTISCVIAVCWPIIALVWIISILFSAMSWPFKMLFGFLFKITK